MESFDRSRRRFPRKFCNTIERPSESPQARRVDATVVDGDGEGGRMNYRNLCRLIEDLCYTWEDSDQSKEMAQKLFDRIYRLSHLAGACLGGHHDWQRQAQQEMGKLKDLRKERFELVALCRQSKINETSMYKSAGYGKIVTDCDEP